MKGRIYLLSLLSLLFLLSGCHDFHPAGRTPLSRERLSGWQSDNQLSPSSIRHHIDTFLHQETFHLHADRLISHVYQQKESFIWIDRNGYDRNRTDSLVAYLAHTTSRCGLPDTWLPLQQLTECQKRLNTPSLFVSHANQDLAFLEYTLTCAYLRMACGLRYGFVNPMLTFNHLEKQDTTANAPYRHLFDIKVEQPTDSFINVALQAARQGSAVEFLTDIEPKDSLYRRFKEELSHLSDTSRRYRTLCANMERRRWRYVRPTGKYVWVNVPAYELYAVDEQGDSMLSMKVCVGSAGHKTPLLHSRIQYVELNPYWVVPYNIVKDEIAPHHAGKADYFIRNRMKIIEKGTKREMDPEEMTKAMYLSGQYTVRQENGEGNSLGRLIFRFPNNFSVFLHDTNNKRAFLRSKRALSHGCVRVEKPLELAYFLMDKPDMFALDKIRLSIDLEAISPEGKKWAASDRYKPIGIYRYKPYIAVYLDYMTAIADRKGTLHYYNDPYGYDEVILKNMGMD